MNLSFFDITIFGNVKFMSKCKYIDTYAQYNENIHFGWHHVIYVYCLLLNLISAIAFPSVILYMHVDEISESYFDAFQCIQI